MTRYAHISTRPGTDTPDDSGARPGVPADNGVPNLSDSSGRTLPMLGIDAVAELLGVSTKTIRRQIKAGKLPVIRIGTAVRITADDLQRFIADARHVRLTPRNGKSKA